MTVTSDFARLIGALSRQVGELQDQAGEAGGFSDLTIRQVIYLEQIEHLGNPTPTELARALRISKPSVSIAIEKLAEAGYLRKVQSDADRRSFHLHLTEKACQAAQAHQRVHEQIAHFLARSLDESELEALGRLLTKLLNQLEAAHA